MIKPENIQISPAMAMIFQTQVTLCNSVEGSDAASQARAQRYILIKQLNDEERENLRDVASGIGRLLN